MNERLARIRESWDLLRASLPGHRFQDRYYRRHRGSHLPLNVWSILNIALGALVVLVGLFFMAAPGPGFLVALLGLALLSSELLPVARLLDRAEVVGRKLGRELLDLWFLASPAVRVALIVLALAVLGALGYGTYYLLFGG
jgi:hypothetical protein